MSGSFTKRVKDWGLRRALYHQLMCTLQRFVDFELAYVGAGVDQRRKRDLEPPEVPADYDTRIVDIEELFPFVSEHTDLTEHFLRTAIENGDQCVANFFKGQLVGYGFSTRTRAVVTDQIHVTVPDGFRYGYKTWTDPEHRRMHLTRMRGFVRRRENPSDYTETHVWYISTHNYPSLLHGYRHPRERGVRMGFVGYVSVLGRQIPFNSRKANWIGFRFKRNDDNRKYYYG